MFVPCISVFEHAHKIFKIKNQKKKTNQMASVYLIEVHFLSEEPVLLEFDSASVPLSSLVRPLESAMRLSAHCQQISSLLQCGLYYNGTALPLHNTESSSLDIVQHCGIQPVSLHGLDAMHREQLIARNATVMYVGQRAQEIYQTLHDFKHGQMSGAHRNKRGEAMYSFGVGTTTSLDRRFIHTVCERMGLYHQSIGRGADRTVIVKHLTGEQSVPRYNAASSAVRRAHGRISLGMTEIIEDFLFLGSGRDANDLQQIAERGISAILNVATEWRSPDHLEQTKILYKKVHLRDLPEESIVPDRVGEVIEHIRQMQGQGKRVLLHCVVGKSRSAAFAMAYLMKEQSMSLREAYEYVKARRSIVHPNEGFIRQLMAFEKMLHGDDYETSLQWDFGNSPRQLQRAMRKKQIKEKEERKRRMKELVTPLLTDHVLRKVLDSVMAKSDLDGSPSVRKLLIADFVHAAARHVEEMLSAKTIDTEEAYDKRHVKSACIVVSREWLFERLNGSPTNDATQ